MTYYRAEYEQNIARLNTPKGKFMKSKRQSTVEPVFGTHTQKLGMRKVNTLGISQANKVMHLSAMAYNLKKHLKFTTKHVKIGVGVLDISKVLKNIIEGLNKSFLGLINISTTYSTQSIILP